MNLLLVSVFTFVINLLFGYWRAHVKRFSWQWFLAIHAPVPLIVLLRVLFELGFAFYTFPVLISSYFLGQFLGGRVHKYCEKSPSCKPTSCLVMDLYRLVEYSVKM